MRAAIYARYSSDNQREESLEDQINSCVVYAKINGISIDQKNHIYSDSAQSGSLRDREGLDKMMQAARENQFDTVMVDDLSRLSRNNVHMQIYIQQLSYIGVNLFSVADNVNTANEDSKLLIQLKGVINENALDELRKRTLRGLLGQKLRGFFTGEKTFGYHSEPYGKVIIDKKGRERPEGYKMYINIEESITVIRIFQMYDEGKAITRIVKELNDESVPSSKHVKNGWQPSTVYRILQNEKYIGKWVWGKKQNKRDPMTGKIRQVLRAVPLHEGFYEELRIINQEVWDRVKTKLNLYGENGTRQKGKRGFPSQQANRVHTFPNELLSGAMVCAVCGGTIGKVSGKGGGYYGCVRAHKNGCTNKAMVRKKVVEPIILAEVSKIISDTDSLNYLLKKVEKMVGEMFATVPEEITFKKLEKTKLQKTIDNFVKFISEGRMSKAIADTLALSEQKLEVVSSELVILEESHKRVFKAPPIEWIADKVSNVKGLLEKMTGQSALLLRQLLGKISLEPVTPDIGKPYLRAVSKLQPLVLLEQQRPRKGPSSFISEPSLDDGSNTFFWWR